MKWEYQFLLMRSPQPNAPINKALLDNLNEAGDQGWEVVALLSDGLHLLMKRAKK